MPLQLVTGQIGELNVTSENAGAYNAGIFGTGQYIMRGLECKMTNATTLHVGPGVASMNGRNIYLDAAGEDVPVAAGASGQNRNDILVARYTKTGTGESLKESVDFVVVKGTPTSGTPSDPSYTAGTILDNPSTVDMPICRIPIRGVAPEALEMLSPTVKPLADLWDSVSQAKVLHSGADYMNDAQSVRLSEPVSSQRTGIVLAWSSFSDNAEQNYGWSYFFVPKSHVGLDGTGGLRCFTLGEDGAMCKYVYVHDDRIDGYVRNAWDGDMSGIRVNNYAYVLRYVYGV